MSETLRILLVDDDEDDRVLAADLLARAQGVRFDVVPAATVDAGLARLREGAFDAVLLDWRLGAQSGLEFLGRMPAAGPAPPVLLLTGQDADGVDMAAMRAGAADYLVKSEVTALLLERAIRYAVEQRRAEAALRESEIRFRQLAENIEAVFWLRDVGTGQVIYVSPAYTRVWGRPADDLYRDPGRWRAYVHPDDIARMRLPDPAEASFEVEYRIVRPCGEVRWIRDRAFPIRGRDGAIYRLAGLAEDITERRAAREALASREAYFRALIENAQDLFVILDGRGRIRDHSPSVERQLGHGTEEIRGRPALSFVHPADLAEVRTAFAALRAEPGAILMREARVRTAAGDWRTMEVTGQNLLAHPAVRGVVVNAHDVTARRRAEAELRASEEQLRLSQRLEAVGRLAGGVAHDFNNLLTAIQGNTEMLLLEAPPEGSLREDLLEIKRAAGRAAGLTRQLLAFSRRQMLQPKVLDLNLIVQDTQRLLRRLIGEDVSLVPRLEADRPRVKADPGQLEQVIVNLAVNARDAMPRGGRLVIATRDARLTEEDARSYPYAVAPGPYVELSVTDTGTGMEPEVLARAFEPFFTTKQPGEGTGLGLSTVYGIVKQSDGYVWAESEPGRGTTFRVFLPAAAAELEAEAPAPVLGDTGPARATVLLVEDEPAVRTLARKILERMGCTVIEAADASEARRRLDEAQGPVDLLMTDVVLPGGSGRELAEAMGQARPGMAVVFMSGYTDDALVRHGVLESRYRLLQKPFSAEALGQVVREALEGAEREQASVRVV